MADVPTYRPFVARVERVVTVGASFRRLTLGGPGMLGFGTGGADQRIKLVLPAPGGATVGLPADGSWYPAWLAAPEDTRPLLRTYTVRAGRPGEIDVDVVLHGVADGHAGPAARWAAAAAPGDEVTLIGPDRDGGGRAWGVEWCPPPGNPVLLLAGDETAVPALGAVLDGLPATARGAALLEVPDPADVVDLAAPAGVELRWLPRCGAVRHGELLTAAVRESVAALGVGGAAPAPAAPEPEGEILWEVPEAPATDGFYAWLAGEAGVVRELRRHLVGEVGVPRSAVAFMGYWRAGHPG